MDSKLRPETLCIQAGYTPKNGEPRQIPIVQSTTFKYDTSEDMGKLFDLEAEGYFYSRLANPTCDAVAAKICALEGGTAAMLTGSGQAANFMAVFNIAGCGDHIVASSAIYGGSFNLFSVTMKKMGLETTFIDPDCTEEELNAAFRPNTKAVFGETIANHLHPAFRPWGCVHHQVYRPADAGLWLRPVSPERIFAESGSGKPALPHEAALRQRPGRGGIFAGSRKGQVGEIRRIEGRQILRSCP